MVHSKIDRHVIVSGFIDNIYCKVVYKILIMFFYFINKNETGKIIIKCRLLKEEKGYNLFWKLLFYPSASPRHLIWAIRFIYEIMILVN